MGTHTIRNWQPHWPHLGLAWPAHEERGGGGGLAAAGQLRLFNVLALSALA